MGMGVNRALCHATFSMHLEQIRMEFDTACDEISTWHESYDQGMRSVDEIGL